MTRPKVLALLCLVLLSTSASAASKRMLVGGVIRVFDKLAPLVGSEASEEIRRHRIARVLGDVTDPQQLVQVVVIAHTLAYPQSAGDERVDAWFETCHWVALERLMKIPGPAAEAALDSIGHLVPLDGGERLQFDEMRARRRAREKHMRND